MNKKRWLPVMILLLLFGILIIAGCGKKEENYRQIQVYKIDGTAMVDRQGSSMEAYENMQLQSGDIIETVAESYLQLKLDEDKYILVEPESKIALQASGNDIDSKTSIFLEKGAVVNQLDNPLSEDSSYEITTPNSTMAVRGTTFRVEITYDDEGNSHAKVAVYGGQVECNLVFPDGTITEPVMVEAGTEVLVWGDDVESDYVRTQVANYEELKVKVIDFLGVIIDRGKELSISKEELEVLKQGLEMLEEEAIEEEIEEEIIEEETSSVEESSEVVSEEETPQEETTQEETAQEESSEQQSDTTTEDVPVVDNPPAAITPKRNVVIEFYYDNQLYAYKEQKVNATATSITVKKPKLVPGNGEYIWCIEKSDVYWIEGFDGEDEYYPFVFQGVNSEKIIFEAGEEDLNLKFTYSSPR